MNKSSLPLPARRLLTAEEASSYCGVSVNTLRAHVGVQPLKIGNSVRYDVKELDRWLDERSQSTVPNVDWVERLGEGKIARA